MSILNKNSIVYVILEIITIYIACSLFAFLLGIVVNSVRGFDSKLWHLIPPLLVVGFLMLTYIFDLGRFLRIFIYTNIGLGLKSILLTLFYDLCNLEWSHTLLTRSLTVFFLIVSLWVALKLYRKKAFKTNELVLAFISVIIFEVAARIEYLSIISFLHRMTYS